MRKYLLIILLLPSIILFSQETKKKVTFKVQKQEIEEDSDIEIVMSEDIPINETVTIFVIVEEMPEFPGGADSLKKYITSYIQYPPEAKQKGIKGKVYVQFTVDKEGNITNARVTKTADRILNAEALRLVNSMPKWKPGYQRGKPANVRYTLPINFDPSMF